MRKTIFVLVILLLVSQVGVGMSAVVDDTVVVVNDEPITAVDLFKTMRFYGIDNPKKAINQAIEDKLVAQRAKKINLTINNNEYAKLKSEFITKKRLKNLERIGLKQSDLEKFIKLQMLKREIISYVVRGNIMVNNNQIKKYYLENKKRFETGELIHLYKIAFSYSTSNEDVQKKNASTWLENIQGGKLNFNDAAAILGYGNFDMGWMNPSGLYPSFYKIIKKMKIGEVYGLIKTKTQFLIIELAGRKNKRVLPLADVRERIKSILVNRSISQSFARWMSTLKQYSSISIYEK